MILKFKKDNSITGDAKTYCCLSVDALFFRLDIKIGPNGVEGFITEMQIEKKKKIFLLFKAILNILFHL